MGAGSLTVGWVMSNWTPEESSRVQRMRRARLSWSEIADVLDLPVCTVVERCRLYGTVRVRSTASWTDDMDAALVAGVVAGRTFRDVAAEVGVTRNAALGRWDRLRRTEG